MKKSDNTGIMAPGCALSDVPVPYFTMICTMIIWVDAIALLAYMDFFPALNEYEMWPFFATLFFAVILLLPLIYLYSHKVILEPDMLIVKRFGIAVRRIPVSTFKLFCVVSGGRECVLCLSCYSVDEMAQMQEERLLRSFLNKHNVPFQKRRADWQDTFARDYLNHLRRNPFRALRERDVIVFKMHSALQYTIRKMYRQLPYKNYTAINSRHVSRFSIIAETRAISFSLQLWSYKARMELDGIHICAGRKEMSFLPAQEIKTAVRVDVFKYGKYAPHHIPLLFVTSLPEEELAAKVPTKGYGCVRLKDTSNQALLAMMAATELAMRWNAKRKDGCVLYHTEKNLETLRSLYPHIQINEIAANWLDEANLD